MDLKLARPVEPMDETGTDRYDVIIIGGGFGGLWAAKALANKPVEVTLIDRKNHHVFQPLLYQVATAVLSPGEVAYPIRRILNKADNIEVILGEVTGFDTEGKTVILDDGTKVGFDHLIVAAGARHAYFGHDDWQTFAPGLKTGMVEGMIGGGAEGYAGLKGLAKVYLDVKDHFEYWFIYMNLDLWKGLSDNERTIIRNAVREMESRRWEIAEAEEQASIKRLRDQGAKIVTFSEAEFARTIAKVRQSVWPEMKKDIGEPFDQVVEGILK